MCKKELLDKAFTEAVTEVNVNMMSDKGVAFEAIEKEKRQTSPMMKSRLLSWQVLRPSMR